MIFYLKSVSLYLTITKVQLYKTIEVATRTQVHCKEWFHWKMVFPTMYIGRKRNLRKHPKLVNLAQQNHIHYMQRPQQTTTSLSTILMSVSSSHMIILIARVECKMVVLKTKQIFQHEFLREITDMLYHFPAEKAVFSLL